MSGVVTGSVPDALTTASPVRTVGASPPVRLLTALVGLILFAVPFGLRLDVQWATSVSSSIRLPLVDLAIWVALLILLVRHLTRWSLGRTSWRGAAVKAEVPVAAWLLVGAGAISLAQASIGAGVTELVQLVDSYLVLPWLLTQWHRAGGGRALPPLAFALLCAMVAAAVWQIASELPTHLLRSLFTDRHAHVAAVFILAPMAWSATARAAAPWRWFGHLIVVASTWTLGSVIATGLVLLSLLATSRLLGGAWLRRSCEVAIASALLSAALPGPYRDAALDRAVTVFSAPMAERRSEVLEIKQTLRAPPLRHHVELGPLHVFVGTDLTRWAEPFASETLRRSGGVARVVPEYFAESWSALRQIATRPFFGAGLGRWRDTVGQSYGILERTGTTSPRSANGYLILALTTGLFGLAAWVGLALRLTSTLARRRRSASIARRDRASAALVSAIAGAVVLLVSPFAIQPVAVLWLLIALTGGARPARKSS